MKKQKLERTLTPPKAGKIFGKLTPSPTQRVLIEELQEGKDSKPTEAGKIISLNRKERRHGDYNIIRKLP